MRHPNATFRARTTKTNDVRVTACRADIRRVKRDNRLCEKAVREIVRYVADFNKTKRRRAHTTAE